MKAIIAKLKNKENLQPEEIEEVMQVIMSGQAEASDVGDFLLGLNAKGPTVDEIAGAARLLQKFAVPVTTRHEVILDTCGTGGDKKNTFNISTLVAIVVAAAGVAVAKHGNRSVSSRCGSADILEAMGVNLALEQQHLNECLDQIGLAFLFAQKLHPAMKNVAPIRKKLGVETIFNILGPLINPARATHQIMGVYSRELCEPIAHVLSKLDVQRALVVHGYDGMDEITTTGKTFISEWDGQRVLSYDLDPKELGLAYASEADLIGGHLEQNLKIARAVLAGQPGPQRDIVVLNAAYALYLVKRVKNISDGIALACECLDAGMADKKLDDLIKFTNQPFR